MTQSITGWFPRNVEEEQIHKLNEKMNIIFFKVQQHLAAGTDYESCHTQRKPQGRQPTKGKQEASHRTFQKRV